MRIVSEHLQKEYGVSERRTCRIISLNRTTKRNKLKSQKDTALIKEIHFLSQKYPRFGYRKIFYLLRDDGWKVGRERVRSIRKQEGLQVIKKQKQKRVLGKSTTQLSKAKYPNHIWSYDIVSDQTVCGKRFRCLTIIDEFTRVGLTIDVGRSITSGHIKRVLQVLFAKWGTPTCIKSDNGPEFIAKEIQRWLKISGVNTRYIDPGSPWQNGHNESFNGVFRDGCLDRWLFYSVQEARRVINSWLDEYNTERPHGALAGIAPSLYLKKLEEKTRKTA